jgi:hypothetical protein
MSVSNVELSKDDIYVLKNMFLYLRDKSGFSEEEKHLCFKLFGVSYKDLK